jgi:glucan phosphoethanolaminetransferase (alkaline phosphatase superfamily)
VTDFIREIAIGIFLSWHIKDHPFWTSFLKGYYVGFVVFILLTLVRIFKDEAILETLKRDIVIFLILGTIVSSVLIVFTFINKYWHPTQR